MERHDPFVRNQGSVLLVKKGNPKKISSVRDLERQEITLFLSNPDTERASFEGYQDTLVNLSGDGDFLERIRVTCGRTIHHREAPEAVIRGKADAAMLYYHLALHYTRRFPDTFGMVPLGGTAEHPDPAPGNIISTTYAGKVLEGGPHGDRFLQFLQTDEVKEIYRLHGLVSIYG
jgi:ABC-type amino acid transport substrate-binding protein